MAVIECRPPPEYDAEPWHWVDTGHGPEPMRWCPAGEWMPTGDYVATGPQLAAMRDWRWIAVVRPPAPAETPIPDPVVEQVWQAAGLASRRVTRVDGRGVRYWSVRSGAVNCGLGSWRAWALKTGARPV